MTKDSVALSEVRFDVSIIPKLENQRVVVRFKLLFRLSRLFEILDYDHVYVESVKVLCVFKCRVIIRSTMTFYLIEKKRRNKANVHKCIRAFKLGFYKCAFIIMHPRSVTQDAKCSALSGSLCRLLKNDCL